MLIAFTKEELFRLILAQGNVFVRISLHGRANTNERVFSSSVSGVPSQQTFVAVKQVKFLMKFLSVMQDVL